MTTLRKQMLHCPQRDAIDENAEFLCSGRQRGHGCGVLNAWLDDVSPELAGRELVPGVLLFVLFWTIFYRIGIWVVVDRPTELRKRIPISGNELRETRKEFYDWLASQGAPPQRKRNTKHLS
jgi:hypothetical protein